MWYRCDFETNIIRRTSDMKSKLLLAFILVYIFNVTIMAGLKQDDVKVYKLNNGLKILMVEDHDIPNIAMYTFFKVGSRNEYPRMTGVSHFIEHMMFNGTEKVGPGEFDNKMEYMGGANNAYTGTDMTAYTDWFPKAALEAMVEMEADRMQGAIFDAKVLESERGVVAEERRLGVENNNEAMLEEQVLATAITAHPYHWDVIGWMSDILNWQRDEILKYYHTYYAPNNAVLIIVGDFETKETLALLKKYYEPIKPGPKPPAITTVEPPQLGRKYVEVKRKAQTPYFMMVFHAPECTNPDFYPMSIIETVLMGGESSRLYKRLVREEQLAVSVGGGIYEKINPYLFSFRVKPKVGADMDKIEAIITEELEKIKKEGVTDREIKKAVNDVKTGFYDELQTIAGVADMLGRAEAIYGDYKMAFSQMDNYSKVTSDDIVKAAKKYFTETNKTVGKLIPTGGEK